MKTPVSLSFVLGLALLSSGCVGSGPNTQRGAVGGAALGALAGAVVGNNSRSHNGLAGAAIGAVVGGLAGGSLGNASDQERGTLYRDRAPQREVVIVEQAPPQREVVYVEVPANHVWVPAHWEQVRNGRVYVPGRWVPSHRY